MQITLIHNPAAGDDQAPDAEALLRLIRRAGHGVLYQSAREPRWSAALDRPADLVVAAGGDGTVGRVARRMIGRGRPMTAISLGTANNIARSLGLVDRPLEEQAASWGVLQPSAIDAGQATGVWGRRVFIEAVGLGLFASLMSEGDRLSLPIALATLGGYLDHQRARRIRATLDGADISGEYLLFEAMNMQFVGPTLYLAPDGRPDDGLLDVVVVRRSERQRLAAYLTAWEAGDHAPPGLPTFQGRSLVIGGGRHAVHLDDRLAPLDRSGSEPTQPGIEVEVLPGALWFLRPEGQGSLLVGRDLEVGTRGVIRHTDPWTARQNAEDGPENCKRPARLRPNIS